MNKVEKIRKEIERLKAETFDNKELSLEEIIAVRNCYNNLLFFIDSLEEEPVSNDLKEAAMQYAKSKHKDTTLQQIVSWDFKAGAQWQKQQDQLTIELAEDHAYLAGQEKIIEKACEWLNNFYSEDRHCYFVEKDIDNFKKAMEE